MFRLYDVIGTFICIDLFHVFETIVSRCRTWATSGDVLTRICRIGYRCHTSWLWRVWQSLLSLIILLVAAVIFPQGHVLLEGQPGIVYSLTGFSLTSQIARCSPIIVTWQRLSLQVMAVKISSSGLLWSLVSYPNWCQLSYKDNLVMLLVGRVSS